ncbi:hypothetical protein OSTOST_19592 [Ostertagia ostertagi]
MDENRTTDDPTRTIRSFDSMVRPRCTHHLNSHQESRPITTRRGYSGYAYLASETNYDIASQPRSLKNYMYTRTYLGTASAPSYWSYYGNSSLRHFNSYRPHNYTPSTASWSRYTSEQLLFFDLSPPHIKSYFAALLDIFSGTLFSDHHPTKSLCTPTAPSRKNA